ncbi:M10 family metallopeptidase C-terminal domain-containing protein [Bradyrhizobium sp. NBAIM03]|uniref:M10 family metallopeptidase C-terminal domain-containing protein n=1 Tax=Bradyrhizobium sp. NBAIM03 TaxID=2793816 RepID=UPI001CD284EE|nr:M10 family metallopeptidase C-terminal domain-containing protein [Bradyrhizobium sp. NBAIM03]MCA1532154.1 M10 family metallopeptidase C-terminal domain-containing protein [Bradyrhizobium sp. NBAIM03]
MATAVNVSATNNAEIDGLLSGVKWSGTITYSFPDAPSDYSNPYYGGSSEPTTSGFGSAPTQIQTAINYAIGLILAYTNADIQYAGTNGADLMIAQSPAANPTAYAYYPGNYAPGGDIWFGTQYNFSLAKLGNYYFTTALHELGHAIGLKHSQEAGGPGNVPVPSAHDNSEYTVMSYRSYAGASTTGGYTNEAYGYSQTYMANDILALQTMYGADYTTQSSSTVYTWNPTTGQLFINGAGQLAPGGGAGGSANRIYETIWDGGGVDTYDLSNYTTNLSINLNPGASSVFSSVQLAYLGDGHYASGNVYNAYLYNGDARSYIENATGGSGNDTIVGNAIANALNGAGGGDTITGGGGNDTIVGGSGTDTAVYSGNKANYGISYNSTTQFFTLVDLRSGTPDGTDTVSGVENFRFVDGTVSSTTLASPPVAIESFGSVELVQWGGYYYLDSISTGTGPTLKSGGAAIAVGQCGPYVPIGAEQTGSGYDVVWKNGSADQYVVWSTDSNGNYVSSLTSVVSGTSTTLQSYEAVLHQDLNGDGTVGVTATTTAIESAGSTTLSQVGSNYYLYTGGIGLSLKSGGVAITVGQCGSYAPIGAEQTGAGYDVVWKNGSADQYVVWGTDSNGNYVSSLTSVVSGTSATLQSYEAVLHQDLNGDGTVGAAPATTAIESAGSTTLSQIGSNYYLYTGGAGPSLKSGGAAITVGQCGSYVPIGAEQTGSGYDVVWKNGSADQYVVWSTDSNGNYVSSLTSVVSGTSATLQSYEAVLHQDLNGDGTVGAAPATTAIESAGSTTLSQIGSNYYLYTGGAGPSLKSGGAAITVGQCGSYVPIGAEQTGSGYDVVWKNGSADQYVVWSTDSNGNYVSSLTSVVSGTSPTLQSYESVLHQDLNGDGTIAAATTGQGAVGDNFAFRAVLREGGGMISRVEPASGDFTSLFHAVQDAFVKSIEESVLKSVEIIEHADTGPAPRFVDPMDHFHLI